MTDKWQWSGDKEFDETCDKEIALKMLYNDNGFFFKNSDNGLEAIYVMLAKDDPEHLYVADVIADHYTLDQSRNDENLAKRLNVSKSEFDELLIKKPEKVLNESVYAYGITGKFRACNIEGIMIKGTDMKDFFCEKQSFEDWFASKVLDRSNHALENKTEDPDHELKDKPASPFNEMEIQIEGMQIYDFPKTKLRVGFVADEQTSAILLEIIGNECGIPPQILDTKNIDRFELVEKKGKNPELAVFFKDIISHQGEETNCISTVYEGDISALEKALKLNTEFSHQKQERIER